jgi:DNA-binding NarL/FixJ family response regulator
MEGPAPIRVVILYVHPLLGEGLAKLLAAEPGIAAAAISTDDAPGTAAALTSRPDAVIIESHEDAVSMTLPGDVAVPLLLFVDIAGAADPAPTTRMGGDPRAAGALRSAGAARAGRETGAPEIRPETDDLERVVRAVRDLKRTRLALVSA